LSARAQSRADAARSIQRLPAELHRGGTGQAGSAMSGNSLTYRLRHYARLSKNH
jgi:hypothetical protein